jgi:hypothetical protein
MRASLRSLRMRAVSAITGASFGSVFPSPRSAPAMVLTTRPGTARHPCALERSTAQSHAARWRLLTPGQLSALIDRTRVMAGHPHIDTDPHQRPHRHRYSPVIAAQARGQPRRQIPNQRRSACSSQSAAGVSSAEGQPVFRSHNNRNDMSATPHRPGHLGHQPQTTTNLGITCAEDPSAQTLDDIGVRKVFQELEEVPMTMIVRQRARRCGAGWPSTALRFHLRGTSVQVIEIIPPQV